MRRWTIFASGVLVALLLVVYAMSFQLRYHEMAVVTTFGRADSASVLGLGSNDAGLHFRWPWPIQQVILFDARTSILEDLLEQQETLDKQVVVIKAFLTWRISQPLDYWRSFQERQSAERFLRDRLRTARAEISHFKFDDLASTEAGKSRLPEAEARVLARVKSELEAHAYGLEVTSVGIKRIVFPEQITSSVFARMRQTRLRLAQNARSEGEALAQSIRAKAQRDEKRLLAFAERMAQSIRSDGDAAAAQYYKTFAQNQELAIFLRKMDTLKATLKNNSTFILDTQMEPFDVLDRKSTP